MKKKQLIGVLLAATLLLAACGKEEPSQGATDGRETETAAAPAATGEATTGATAAAPSGTVTLEMLMQAPENSEDDFECGDAEEGCVDLLTYVGTSEIVVIPETWHGKKITAISPYVFANDSPVKAIRLSDSVQDIMMGAFGLNESLEIVVCGDGLRNIGEAAFRGCENLNTVVLNDGLEMITSTAFLSCTSLAELEIPSSVSEIQAMAFYDMPDDFTIIGTSGSAAEEYANSEGIAFRAK